MMTTTTPDGARFRLSSVTINGCPVSGTASYDIAMSMWDQGARKMLRRLYRHHLPRRLRREIAHA